MGKLMSRIQKAAKSPQAKISEGFRKLKAKH